MQITAKFNGKCVLCKGNLPKGSRIEWSRGNGAQHLQCDPNVVIKDGKTLEQLADEWDREHADDLSSMERFEQMRVSRDYQDVPEDAIFSYASQDTARNPYRRGGYNKYHIAHSY
jgi:hypothetical protein